MRRQLALLILVFSFHSASLADDRQPVPGESAQKQAADLVQEILGDQIKAAIRPDEKLALTNRLIEESQKGGDPAERYAILEAALNVAPDALAAMPVVKEMARHFQIDVMKQQASTVWRMSQRAKTSSQHKAVTEAALQLVDELMRQNDYGSATTLAEIASIAAAKSRDGKLVRETKTKTFEINKGKGKFEKLQTALATLETNPADPTANLTAGRYYCLEQGDWGRGIPMLALGGDSELGRIARSELAVQESGQNVGALADAWWALAGQEEGGIKAALMTHAAAWYQKALLKQQGLARVRTEKRLEEFRLITAKVTTTSPHNRGGRPAPPGRTRAARSGPLRVLYKQGDQAADDNQLKPHLKILNSGRDRAALSEVTLRYWFTVDGPPGQRQKLSVDYAKLDGRNISGTFHRLAKPTSTADSYLEIRFSEQTAEIEPGRDSGPIQLRINKTDWKKYNETNDFSFGGGEPNADFKEFDRITLYHKGELVWGIEPTPRPRR
ncbi:MAG: cellulose binding domain-containing protein [Pirellulales bacterium]